MLWPISFKVKRRSLAWGQLQGKDVCLGATDCSYQGYLSGLWSPLHSSCAPSAWPLFWGGTTRCFWEIWGTHQHDYPDDQKNPQKQKNTTLPLHPYHSWTISLCENGYPVLFKNSKFWPLEEKRKLEEGRCGGKGRAAKSRYCLKHLNEADRPSFLERTHVGGWGGAG